MKLARGILALSGVAFAFYGLQCLFQPGAVTQNAQLGLATATATTEVRAMYGGLQIGLGVLFGVSALRARMTESGLVTLVIVFASLAGARALGLVLDGSDGMYNPAALVFEATSAAVGMIALRRGSVDETVPAL